MEVYRSMRECCVCGKPMSFMQRRYEYGGITAHPARAEYVEAAAEKVENHELSIVAFRDKMREETQEIEK